jgi:hypothetical protein
MKKLFSMLIFLTLAIFALKAQPVSEYNYKLDNGITIKTERCWNQVWVQQSFAPMTAADKTPPLAVNIRALGDLISGSAFKLMSAGKEVRMQGAAPGTYDLRMTFKLSGKPGTLSFVVGNIVIKANTKTSVSVTLYDYQIMIAETPASLNGFSAYETLINRCKGNTIQDIYFGIPSFYAKGQHDKPIPPDQTISKTTGRIKAGTYDLLISIGISGQTQKVWLENFMMKPDINYKITTNLNAGGITYSGGNKDVNALLLYPAGTAAKQTGNPAPNKNLEIINYSSVAVANCCSPGTYDVLLNFKNGSKYEWRKNVVIQTGIKTDVK